MQIHHRKAKNCTVRHGLQRGGGTEHEMDLSHCQDGTLSVEDGQVSGANVYDICHKDIKIRSDAAPNEKFICPTAGKYIIRCGDDGDNLPQQIKAMAGEAIALDTEGLHCACAVHAVFGAPATSGKLSAPGARQLARELLAQAPNKAGSSPSVHRRLIFLVQTFWEEFMLRHFRGEPTVESRLFWEALRTTAPRVAEESKHKYDQYMHRLQLVRAAKKKTRLEAKSFFTDAMQPFIRSLAEELGYLPTPGN